MGASSSVPAIHGRIDAVLPHHTFELARTPEEQQELVKNVRPIFPGGHSDRARFTHSLRVLLSSNGQVPLADKRFKLVFSRAPEEFNVIDDDSNAQIFATVVAMSPDGVLAAKVVSERAGRDNIEAFQMLRKTVEIHMHKVLDSVPGPGEVAGASTAPMSHGERNVSGASLASTVLPDEPPAYQEASK